MEWGEEIALDVPGTKRRWGTFVEKLPFDDFVKVQIHKDSKDPYFYLAHAKDVTRVEWMHG